MDGLVYVSDQTRGHGTHTWGQFWKDDLVALLARGHALLVGLPGLGKTRLVDTLATVMGLQGGRIQFTPDLMPADILGSEVLDTDAEGRLVLADALVATTFSGLRSKP